MKPHPCSVRCRRIGAAAPITDAGVCGECGARYIVWDVWMDNGEAWGEIEDADIVVAGDTQHVAALVAAETLIRDGNNFDECSKLVLRRQYDGVFFAAELRTIPEVTSVRSTTLAELRDELPEIARNTPEIR